MTVQPTRDQLRALADAATEGPWEVHGSLIGIGRAKPDFGQTWGLRWRQDIEFICAARTAVPQLLDQLDAAEQRIRDLTQEARDERAACLDQVEQVRIRDTRIKAVEDVLDAEEARPRAIGGGYDTRTTVRIADIRRALNGYTET